MKNINTLNTKTTSEPWKSHWYLICLLTFSCGFSWVNVNCTKDVSIKFFEHQYRINARTISREQRLRMRNENTKTVGTFFSTVVWLCGRSYSVHAGCSFVTESNYCSWRSFYWLRSSHQWIQDWNDYTKPRISRVNILRPSSAFEMHLSITRLSLSTSDHMFPKVNPTQEISKAITVFRWHKQSLLPCPTFQNYP